MNITNEEIKDEFKRQVKLCQGIGKKEMLNILNSFEFPSYLASHPEPQPQEQDVKTEFMNASPSETRKAFYKLKKEQERQTAEEILVKITGKSINYLKQNYISFNKIVDAMEEYANQSQSSVLPSDANEILTKFQKHFNSNDYGSIEGWIIEDFIREELSQYPTINQESQLKQGYPKEFCEWSCKNAYWDKFYELFMLRKMSNLTFKTLDKLHEYWLKEVKHG